jgi:hypothetical protein
MIKRSFTATGIAMAALLLGCGGGDETPAADAATSAAAETPAPAPPMEAPKAAAEAPVVAATPDDASKQCLALAAQQKWSEALEPCTKAAEQYPTDLRIKHAVQQAQAAAGS